jgi:hypothetical protein
MTEQKEPEYNDASFQPPPYHVYHYNGKKLFNRDDKQLLITQVSTESVIATMPRLNRTITAEFIVKACNCHAELVKPLKEIKDIADSGLTIDHAQTQVISAKCWMAIQNVLTYE